MSPPDVPITVPAKLIAAAEQLWQTAKWQECCRTAACRSVGDIFVNNVYGKQGDRDANEELYRKVFPNAAAHGQVPIVIVGDTQARLEYCKHWTDIMSTGEWTSATVGTVFENQPTYYQSILDCPLSPLFPSCIVAPLRSHFGSRLNSSLHVHNQFITEETL